MSAIVRTAGCRGRRGSRGKLGATWSVQVSLQAAAIAGPPSPAAARGETKDGIIRRDVDQWRTRCVSIIVLRVSMPYSGFQLHYELLFISLIVNVAGTLSGVFELTYR